MSYIDIDYKIRNGDYRAKSNYPKLPREPHLPSDLSKRPLAEQMKILDQHKIELTSFSEAKAIYDAAKIELHTEEAQLHERFMLDVFEALDIQDNPKRDKLFALAWERGHSGGMSEVWIIAQDLVELIRPEPEPEFVPDPAPKARRKKS